MAILDLLHKIFGPRMHPERIILIENVTDKVVDPFDEINGKAKKIQKI